jgi:hypothetical protein
MAALVNTVINLCIPYKTREVLTSYQFLKKPLFPCSKLLSETVKNHASS